MWLSMDAIVAQLEYESLVGYLIKCLAKLSKMVSICPPSSSSVARLSMVKVSCVLQDLHLRKPCWESTRMLLWLKCDVIAAQTICSSSFLQTDVRKMGF